MGNATTLIMGNGACFYEARRHTISLDNCALKKVLNFVTAKEQNNDSLHFIVLEGDCVLVTINRLVRKGEPKFKIQKFWINENGQISIVTSRRWKRALACINEINRRVSAFGVPAIEDVERKAIDVICHIFAQETVDWNVLEGKTIDVASMIRSRVMNQFPSDVEME